MASGSPFDHITDVPDDIAGELPPTNVIPTQNYDQSSWNRRPQFCRLVWTAFEDPGSSWVAAILGVGITLLIILALTAFVLETLPEYHGRDLSPFPEIELFCTVVFCMEYTIRLACCPKFLAFLRDPWNLADFLAVLPLLAIPDSESSFWARELSYDTSRKSIRTIILVSTTCTQVPEW
jgi:hypothetical protein